MSRAWPEPRGCLQASGTTWSCAGFPTGSTGDAEEKRGCFFELVFSHLVLLRGLCTLLPSASARGKVLGKTSEWLNPPPRAATWGRGCGVEPLTLRFGDAARDRETDGGRVTSSAALKPASPAPSLWLPRLARRSAGAGFGGVQQLEEKSSAKRRWEPEQPPPLCPTAATVRESGTRPCALGRAGASSAGALRPKASSVRSKANAQPSFPPHPPRQIVPSASGRGRSSRACRGAANVGSREDAPPALLTVTRGHWRAHRCPGVRHLWMDTGVMDTGVMDTQNNLMDRGVADGESRRLWSLPQRVSMQ